MFGVFEGPLVFSFLFAAAVIGCFALLVLAVIPAVYSFPYLVWFGFNCGTKGLPKEMSWLGPPEWFFLHQAETFYPKGFQLRQRVLCGKNRFDGSNSPVGDFLPGADQNRSIPRNLSQVDPDVFQCAGSIAEGSVDSGGRPGKLIDQADQYRQFKNRF